MSLYPAPLARLVQELSKLPGIGEKTAARLAFYMLKAKRDEILRLAESIGKLLIHYPSYILYAAIAGRIDWYFYVYIGVNAVYALRAFAGVALRFGRA